MIRAPAFLFVILMVLAASPLFADVGGEAADQYYKAYLLKNDAERLEQAGDFAGALQKYCEAEQIIAHVKRNYPHWQPEVIDYRLKMIRAAEQRLAAKEEPPPSAAPPNVSPHQTIPQTPSGLTDALEQLNQLRKELREREEKDADKKHPRHYTPKHRWSDLGLARQVA